MAKTTKRVVITGASRGIGAAIAEEYFNNGYDLILLSRTKPEFTEKIDFHWQKIDLQGREFEIEISELFNEFSPNVLINNAGDNIVKSLLEVTQKDIDMMLSINLIGPLLLMKESLKHMTKEKFGRIVNIGSIWSQQSKAGRALYSMTKFGLNGLTVAASAEFSKCNILINTISPGVIETDLTNKTLSASQKEELLNQIPLKRIGAPKEIAELVYYLGSEKNTYITGQNIFIDGGFSNAR